MRGHSHIWVVLFFILLSTALAANPHNPELSTGAGIQIAYIHTDFYPAFQNYTIYWHIYNSTNFRVTNATANCTIHIYNQSGSHSVEAEALGDDGGIDFDYPVTQLDLQQPGLYAYNIYCINGKEAGFVRDEYMVATENSLTEDVGGSPLAIIILIPLIFGILCIVGAGQLGESHGILKAVAYLMAYICGIASLWLGTQAVVRYYYFTGLQNSMATITYAIGIVMFVVLSYLLIHAFVVAIEMAAQQKKARLEY